MSPQEKKETALAVLPEGSRLNPANASASKGFPLASPAENEAIEKAARSGYDEQLGDLFDKLRGSNR